MSTAISDTTYDLLSVSHRTLNRIQPRVCTDWFISLAYTGLQIPSYTGRCRWWARYSSIPRRTFC